MKAVSFSSIRSLMLAGAAVLAIATPVKAEVSVYNMDTGTSTAMSNTDYAQNYSAALARQSNTAQVAGCFSPGGYNQGKCVQLSLWDRIIILNSPSNGGRSAPSSNGGG